MQQNRKVEKKKGKEKKRRVKSEKERLMNESGIIIYILTNKLITLFIYQPITLYIVLYMYIQYL